MELRSFGSKPSLFILDFVWQLVGENWSKESGFYTRYSAIMMSKVLNLAMTFNCVNITLNCRHPLIQFCIPIVCKQ